MQTACLRSNSHEPPVWFGVAEYEEEIKEGSDPGWSELGLEVDVVLMAVEGAVGVQMQERQEDVPAGVEEELPARAEAAEGEGRMLLFLRAGAVGSAL